MTNCSLSIENRSSCTALPSALTAPPFVAVGCCFASALRMAGSAAASLVSLLLSGPERCLAASWRNSSSEKSSSTLSLSAFTTFSSSSLNSSGTSVRMVARNCENFICSTLFSILPFSVPLSLSVLASRLLMLPNSCSSFTAVFSPMPGQPGMLSLLSPIRPSRSIIWFLFASPYFSVTSFSPITSYPPLWRGRYIYTLPPTSWP